MDAKTEKAIRAVMEKMHGEGMVPSEVEVSETVALRIIPRNGGNVSFEFFDSSTVLGKRLAYFSLSSIIGKRYPRRKAKKS